MSDLHGQLHFGCRGRRSPRQPEFRRSLDGIGNRWHSNAGCLRWPEERYLAQGHSEEPPDDYCELCEWLDHFGMVITWA